MLRQMLAAGLMGAFGWIGLAAEAATISIHVSDDDGTPVANAVVFLLGADGAPLPGEPARSKIAQRNEEFRPFVLPVQVGATVEFPNEDPFRHHVYSFSPGNSFELKLYGGDELQEVTFDQAGEVALGCNIHDHMLAYIYVVDTPFFAATDENGTATIEGLSEGLSYQAQAWHPRLRGSSRRTAQEVTSGSSVEFTIRLRPDRRNRGSQDFESGDY